MLANIEVDKVANMEMDKVVDIVADMEVYKDICVTRVICGTYSIESFSHFVFVFVNVGVLAIVAFDLPGDCTESNDQGD